VKSFEYVYHLSLHLLCRALRFKAISPAEIDATAFQRLIRTAAEKGLIDDPLRWYIFRDKRNSTTLTYDQSKAIDVLAVVPKLIGRARFLLARLSAREAP
jgi:nucleotidyltransferase substrate binding protein (TIGR01987 family)